MTSQSANLDSFNEITRVILMDVVPEPSTITNAFDRVEGTDLQVNREPDMWTMSWRGHELSMHVPATAAAEVAALIPMDCEHGVNAILTVTVNDSEGEAVAWHLASSFVSGAATWYDGERMVAVPYIGPAVLDLDEETIYPRQLWSTVRVAIGSPLPFAVDALADALEPEQNDSWSRIDNEHYELEMRLVSAEELGEELLAPLVERHRPRPPHWLEVLAHGPHGYAASAELAGRLARASETTLTWVDQGGNTATVTEATVVFDDTPLPDALMYLRDYVSEWQLAEVLVPYDGERVAGDQGIATWQVPTATGPVQVTLEKDGVVDQMNSSGVTSWLTRFDGKAGSIVLFRSQSGSGMDGESLVAQLISDKFDSYWLPRTARDNESPR